MTAIVGYNGSMKLGANQVAEIGDWQLTIDSAMLDVTKLGDSWKDQLQGLKSWNVKASGRWDMTDTNGQVALQNAYLNGTSVTVSMYVNATHYYSGNAFVKTLNVKDNVSAALDIDFTLDGNGPISYT